jgi:hypothetical protein
MAIKSKGGKFGLSLSFHLIIGSKRRSCFYIACNKHLKQAKQILRKKISQGQKNLKAPTKTLTRVSAILSSFSVLFYFKEIARRFDRAKL